MYLIVVARRFVRCRDVTIWPPDLYEMNPAVTLEQGVMEKQKPFAEATDGGGSDIQKFYRGTTILVTGGTGFVGRLLIEKLLRSCPDIHRLYILARPKKNKSIAKRLQEQFDDVLYDRLRKEKPDFIKKIAVVEGEMGAMDLGISPEDRIKIVKEVEIIFHGAATVRFDEPLKKAVEINVRGTREICKLARECGKLKSMIYISTAYSNCILNEIEERLYESPFPGETLIDLVETVNKKIINNITPGLVGDYPNTYAYTKAVAEDIVQKYCKGLPVAIYRFSILVATAKEPIAGWIDSVYGPTGVVVGVGVGVLHVLNSNPSAVIDLVPGDMVINACIATAWKTAKKYPGNQKDAPPLDLSPPVYNFVSSEQQPLTWKNYVDSCMTYGSEMPTIKAVYCCLLHMTPSRFIYNLYCFFLHWIPAYLIDGTALLIGKRPMLRKSYRKIRKLSEVMNYFSSREWKFHNDNVRILYTELCEADKKMFDFDFSRLNWSDYFHSYIRGIRLYILKDPLDTIPAAIRKHYKLMFIHYLLCFILLSLPLWLLWSVLCLIIKF